MEPPQPFTWSSSNAAVVTVSSTGVVQSVGPEGSAIITATVDTFSAELGVFVGTPPAGDKVAKLDLDPAAGAAVTADGRYFVSAEGTFVGGQLPAFAFDFQVPTGGQFAEDVVVNGAGTLAYLIGTGPGVVVVDLTTHAVVDSIPVHLGRAFTGGFSEDGSILTVGTELGFERIDLVSKASLGAAATGYVLKITHHPSRPLLYASGEAGVLELDDRSGAIVRRFAGHSQNGHAVSPDGMRLYAVSFGGSGVQVWNLETGAPERTLPYVSGSDAAISSDGRFLYVLHGGFDFDNRMTIHDVASGAELRSVSLGGLARRIALAPDGTAIITNENSSAGAPGWVDFVR
jgi:DNA-binding beta-propeller fold protein YncE